MFTKLGHVSECTHDNGNLVKFKPGQASVFTKMRNDKDCLIFQTKLGSVLTVS